VTKETEILIKLACICVIGYFVAPVIEWARVIVYLNPWLLPLMLGAGLASFALTEVLRSRYRRG
jgi:hypothetical protein